jgi:alpha-tubulin suppressor-like RCC1 family protein
LFFGIFAGAISATSGDTHSCALLNDSSVYCWGANDYGQLGTGDFNPYLSPQAVVGLATGDSNVSKLNVYRAES